MKKNQYAHILLIVSFVILLCCSAVSATQEDLSICESGITAAIVKRINEVRENPWAEAERLGFDVQELREQIGPLAEIWDQGLPPLLCDERLTHAAQGHIHDMLENFYYSHTSLDGSGPWERIQAFGVEPLLWAESMGAVVFENVIATDEAAELILDGLLIDAFNGGEEGRSLLDKDMTKIGAMLNGGQLELDDNVYNVYVILVDVAHELPVIEEGVAVIWGHVYVDANSNDQYDIGEGIPNILVSLVGPLTDGDVMNTFGPVGKQYCLTKKDGAFYFYGMSGTYVIDMEIDGMLQFESISLGSELLYKDVAKIEWF